MAAPGSSPANPIFPGVTPMASYTGAPGSSPANPLFPGTQPGVPQPNAQGNYASTPSTTVTTPASTAAPATTTAPSNATPGGSPDSAYSQAKSNIAPTGPESEDDFFTKLYSQFAPVIDSINKTETDAETAAYNAGSEAQTDLNASLGSRGLAGSSEAATLNGNANLNVAGNIAQARQAQSTALSNAFQYLTGQAHTEFTDARTRGDTLSQNYVTAMQSNALATVKGIAESGITSGTELQQKNPQAYAALLQYYDGDPNALNSALVMNQPNNKVVQSWTNGSTYYQLVTDPVTGHPKVQSVDTGINVPTSWTANKVSTTTLMMQDPNNPANSVIYTTDPITGSVTVSGTGTGQAIASEYNSSSNGGSGNNGTSSSASNAASQNYITTATSTAGIADPTTLFSTAVNGDGTSGGSGIGALVAGIMKAEGGSITGVSNNPGNVKYVAGMAGATNSGVKATDGGTFASFNTPQDGQKAVANTLQNISTNLGPNATVQDVLDKYANLSPTTNGTNQTDSGQYGLLSGVSGFNPGTPGDPANRTQAIDQFAFNYLQSYLSGSTPSSTSGMGGATTLAEKNEIQSRAEELYKQATGQTLPNQTELKANLGFINNNNALLTSLSNQEGTIQANSDLLQGNITAANINENVPAINRVIDGFSNFFQGNPDVASYLAQNSTLGNELGSLLALKNASGTTVHDKLISADLLSPDASAAQEAAVVNTLMKEAQNGRAAITLTNAKLYGQTDPLQIDPQNPLNDPTSFAQSVGLDIDSIQKDYPGMTPQEIVAQYVQNN